MLLSMGFHKVITLDFDKVKTLSPEEFLNLLVKNFGATHFSVGYNYHFGKGASGNAKFLREYCNKYSLTPIITDGVKENGEYISSSAIRQYLKEGNVKGANSFLGRRFSYTATVIAGDKRGRTIGVPTINQHLPQGLVQVKFGVYHSFVELDGQGYNAITNIGLRPTYEVDTPILETHIIGFSGDLYGKNVTVQLVDYIRPEQKFTTLEELTTAIKNDIATLN